MPSHLGHGLGFISYPCCLLLMPAFLRKGSVPERQSCGWEERKGAVRDQVYMALLNHKP